jgi:hypothetical protein
MGQFDNSTRDPKVSIQRLRSKEKLHLKSTVSKVQSREPACSQRLTRWKSRVSCTRRDTLMVQSQMHFLVIGSYLKYYCLNFGITFIGNYGKTLYLISINQSHPFLSSNSLIIHLLLDRA